MAAPFHRGGRVTVLRRLVISAGFSEAERQRFHNLLQLAAESPFEGERTNALAAAQRLAERCGLTLEEAAAGDEKQEPLREAPRDDSVMADDLGMDRDARHRFARAAHLMDGYIMTDKMRREAALREAQARGLDAEELRKAVTASVTQRKTMRQRRMNPNRHATMLLRETSLSFREIANITGLDVYAVVGLKLKLRAAG
ncbi:MAG: hypothetical protein ACFB13_23730 [Kiloniellaceae bacterium]